MEKEAIKTLKAAKAQVENILMYQDDLRRILAYQHVNNMKRALAFMVIQLEKAINGEVVSPTSEEKNLVGEIVRAFASVAMEKPIEPIFRDLSASFLPIVHNWNAATINNPDITINIRMIDGLIKAQLTFMDTLTVIQKTLERVRKTHSYEPPAFNLSRAYLDNLKKAIEEKGPDAFVPKKQENASK
jgi:hypothetical protein